MSRTAKNATLLVVIDPQHVFRQRPTRVVTDVEGRRQPAIPKADGRGRRLGVAQRLSLDACQPLNNDRRPTVADRPRGDSRRLYQVSLKLPLARLASRGFIQRQRVNDGVWHVQPLQESQADPVSSAAESYGA